MMNRLTIPLVLVTVVLCSWTMPEPLRIAAWNLEHLSTHETVGCISRTEEDFDRLRNSIVAQDFDIVAFQEVADIDAAQKIFPKHSWNIELSRRPPKASTLACRDTPGRYLPHLATGFAIKKGLSYTRNEDVSALGLNRNSSRWGTDITIKQNHSLRLLSVHLTTGCWSSAQDQDETRNRECNNLKQQFESLVKWRDDRLEANESFVILGDFNRRLAIADDWGWKQLFTHDDKIQLLTSGIKATCDPMWPHFIDHIVVGDLDDSLYSPNSFKEGPRISDHPDHCAVSAEFTLK